MKNEVILTRGTTSPGFYFLVNGTVGMYHYQHPNICLFKVSDGSYFGTFWLINEAEHYDIV